MITNQQLYTQACDSLRTYGNTYGSFDSRKWGWVNKYDPNQRCAIARFIAGTNDFEVCDTLKKELQVDDIMSHPLIADITRLFDYSPETCNNKQQLEIALQRVADKHKLSYTSVSEMETA